LYVRVWKNGFGDEFFLNLKEMSKGDDLLAPASFTAGRKTTIIPTELEVG
jgi:hypothetical protein